MKTVTRHAAFDMPLPPVALHSLILSDIAEARRQIPVWMQSLAAGFTTDPDSPRNAAAGVSGEPGLVLELRSIDSSHRFACREAMALFDCVVVVVAHGRSRLPDACVQLAGVKTVVLVNSRSIGSPFRWIDHGVDEVASLRQPDAVSRCLARVLDACRLKAQARRLAAPTQRQHDLVSFWQLTRSTQAAHVKDGRTIAMHPRFARSSSTLLRREGGVHLPNLQRWYTLAQGLKPPVLTSRTSADQHREHWLVRLRSKRAYWLARQLRALPTRPRPGRSIT